MDGKAAHRILRPPLLIHICVSTEQVRNLRERLEEEHQALLQREQDKAILEVRIARLTRIILHSTRIAKPNPSFGYRYRQLLLQESQVPLPTKNSAQCT